MKNEYEKLYNDLLGDIEKLADKDLTSDALALEIQRCKTINELAKTAIAAAALIRRSENVQENKTAQ